MHSCVCTYTYFSIYLYRAQSSDVR